MAGNNKIAELMKMMEIMEARIERSKKKIELMGTILHTLSTNILKDRGERPRNEEQEDKGNRQPRKKRKEGKGEKGTPQTDLRVDRKELVLKDSSMFYNYFNYYVGVNSIPKRKITPEIHHARYQIPWK